MVPVTCKPCSQGANHRAAAHGGAEYESGECGGLRAIKPLCCCEHVSPLGGPHMQPRIGNGRVTVVPQIHGDD